MDKVVTLKDLKKEFNYFANLTDKLANSKEQNGPKLVKLFDTIHNKAVLLSDSFDFNPDFTPVVEVSGSGDYGDIESGANMLYYYRELLAEPNENNNSLDKVYSIFQGGAKIKYKECLYVNYAYENPAFVYEETPKRLSGVTNAIAMDIKAYLIHQ